MQPNNELNPQQPPTPITPPVLPPNQQPLQAPAPQFSAQPPVVTPPPVPQQVTPPVAPQAQQQFPQPPIASVGSTPSAPKFPIKKLAIIGGIIAGLAALGFGAWLLIGTVMNTVNAVPLTTYDEGEYSIGIPEGYTKQESLYTDEYIAQLKQDEEDLSEEGLGELYTDEFIAELRQKEARTWQGGTKEDSYIRVSKSTLSKSKETYIKQLRVSIEEPEDGVKNVSLAEKKIGLYDTAIISFDTYDEDDALEAKSKLAYVFVDEEFYYTITLQEDPADKDLLKTIEQIVGSLKVTQ